MSLKDIDGIECSGKKSQLKSDPSTEVSIEIDRNVEKLLFWLKEKNDQVSYFKLKVTTALVDIS